jgi:2-amino-4-hydroxy-6-hydroxymethyldihydropteridine diphosphokinase
MNSFDERVFVGLGSNLGDRLAALRQALDALNALVDVDVVRVSSVYETEPVGVRQQPDFLNAVVEIRCLREPEQLLEAAQEIEQQMGRRRRLRWGPREIDIDLLLWGSRVVDSVNLTIPHPELARRNFVLAPLAEIAPEFESPTHKVSLAELFHRSADPSRVRIVAPAGILTSEVGVAP